jgi:quercetin dioxygenase-like cupin family protein
MTDDLGAKSLYKRRRKMQKVVNIERCFEKFNDTYSPKIVGNVNTQSVMVVRLEGDKVPWHTHDKEDDINEIVIEEVK